MITIKSFRYGVSPTIAPGAMIMVSNGDGRSRTVTADTAGGFDFTANAGASASFAAPTKPGSYPFHCTYHANMHGVLIVQ